MPVRSALMPARSRNEWVARGGVALLTTFILYFCITRTFAQIAIDRRPALALVLAPENARAQARLGLDLFMQKPTSDPSAYALELARKALNSDPTAISAVVTLGMQADARKDVATARKLFAYSQLLSRRDLPTQIWAIEDAVGRGEVADALHHYDVALRTSRTASQTLFPILTVALDEPQIRTGLVRTFADRPAWMSAFVAYAIADSKSPISLVALFDAMNASRVPVAPEASASLVNRLVVFGDFGSAWRYYVSLHPRAERRISRDPRFAADISNPAPFDWNVINSTEVSASFQNNDQGGLSFSIPPNGGGIVASQLQILPPGSYRLSGRSSRVSQDEQSLPYWSLNCRNGRQLLRVTVPNTDRSGGRFGGTVVVPNDCPVQTLTLVGQSSETIGGTDGQIDEVTLAPLSRR